MAKKKTRGGQDSKGRTIIPKGVKAVAGPGKKKPVSAKKTAEVAAYYKKIDAARGGKRRKGQKRSK